MPTFGIIAEGLTDQYVIENVLRGFFGGSEDDLVVNYVQPPLDATGRAEGAGKTGDKPPAGWTLVFKALRDGEHRKALQFNDHVIVQIDTDVCEERGFDVPRREDGVELSPDDLAERVSARLRSLMGDDFCEAHADKLLFAIAVNSTECWLLPLLYPDKKSHKISGCLSAANHALRLANRKGLASEDSKYHRIYDEVSRPYASPRELKKHRHRNRASPVSSATSRIGSFPVRAPDGVFHRRGARLPPSGAGVSGRGIVAG